MALLANDEPRPSTSGSTSATQASLGTILGAGDLKVNSFHHQAIARLGQGLRDVAWAPDGVIEAVEAPDTPGFVVGVQWHPEELVDHDPAAHRLFSALITATRR